MEFYGRSRNNQTKSLLNICGQWSDFEPSFGEEFLKSFSPMYWPPKLKKYRIPNAAIYLHNRWEFFIEKLFAFLLKQVKRQVFLSFRCYHIVCEPTRWK